MCCFWCIIAIAVGFLYILFDVNYFIRLAFTIIWGRLFQKKKNIEEITEIYGIATTADVGIVFNHMNNARYCRELDFARFHFFDRTGLHDEVSSAKAILLQAASNIRYRRMISTFTPYKITTQIIAWDEKALYFEQRFITFDGFVRATVLSKQASVGLDVPKVMAKLTGKDISYRPVPPPELEDWLKSMEKSSLRLRKKD
ncbi:protein THEM6-like [Coccinella septempunctata]|uniref:protein THEM6-like n=1 Tax=Coccinella septempunctata TaxID=41139 RepID=UPI001D0987C2|nr:protein THEM6-like [Coccinella septempunctata]